MDVVVDVGVEGALVLVKVQLALERGLLPCARVLNRLQAVLKVVRTVEDVEGYAETLVRMLDLAERQPGYLGRVSATTADGDELTFVYYTDDEAIRAWHDDPEHLVAQHLANSRWYECYEVRVARVERAYRYHR